MSLGSETAHLTASMELVGAPRPAASAISLPPTLVARAFGTAWAIALAVHLVLAAAVVLAPRVPSSDEPMVRLVYLEPPPPPPAPLGVPAGAGTAPAGAVPEAPRVESARVEKPAEPVPSPAHRLRKVEKRAKPKPPPAPPPFESAATAAAAVDVAAGVATGSVGGEAGGVGGGVTGGISGGVVGGAGAGPIPAGQVAQPPVLLRKVAPTYPSNARQREIEGLVVLEAVLDHEGRVEPGVRVLESLPPLDQEAVSAVRKWRFRPARDAHGNTLRVLLEIPIRFVLR